MRNWSITARVSSLKAPYGRRDGRPSYSLLLLLMAGPVLAQPTNLSVTALANLARPSVTVISHYGREAGADGVGSGFVISSNGLIATAFHVIDEARRVGIRLADGTKLEAVSVHAWDRKLDLAILRVGATNLPALQLGDSSGLNQGDSVVAMGNPLGLEHSIVEGVVSAMREIEGQEMIQLAIPIEPGNSGGPLLDRQGRVQGILDMKSALTANLGFAIPINHLKPLLEKPNPVLMERWIKIGTLSNWQPLFGAHWSQKAGHIHVEGKGTGFGGRSLCLSQTRVPKVPYEIAVSVRLQNEDGAAGLLFSSDGAQKHYGFYPTAGQLRLTRFDGPDVYSWTILDQTESPHYRPNAWNWIKVRREPDKILCYLNGHLVFESKDQELPEGSVGLAKFRDTEADFKHFQIGENLQPTEETPTPEVAAKLKEQIDAAVAGGESTQDLADQSVATRGLLAERIRQLETQAEQLKRLAGQVHETSVRKELAELFGQAEEQIDLLAAALLVAKLDNPDLITKTYLEQVETMAAEILKNLAEDASEEERLKALRTYLFTENGFHGSRTDYYNRANSYMNEVIDDREGLPIALSVLFMELGRRIHLPTLAGIGLPGHFVVRHQPTDTNQPPQLLDVFEGAKPISVSDAGALVLEHTGGAIRTEQLQPVTKRQIIVRMFENLLGIAQSAGNAQDSLRYLDAILDLDPDNAMRRGLRAMIRARNHDTPGAKRDLEWIIERAPEGIDLDRITEYYRSL